MTRILTLLAALAALALPACAPVGQPEPQRLPPEAMAEGVTVTKVEGGRFLVFAGPKRQHTDPYLGQPNTNYYLLRSFIDTHSGQAAYQLYVQYSYDGGPYKWNAARDEARNNLRFIPVTHDEIACEPVCAYADEFAAAIPERMLRQNTGGFSVTFTGPKNANKTVAVDGALITEQLGAVDTVRETLKTAAAKAEPGTVVPGATVSPPGPVSAPPVAPAVSQK